MMGKWVDCRRGGFGVLGDYAYLKNGYAFKSKDYVDASENTHPVIRISDIDGMRSTDINAVHIADENKAEGFEVSPGDLLIAMSGATTGKVGLFQGKIPAYQNQRVGNIKLHSSEYGSPSFRNYVISSLSGEILKVAYGGAQPNISGSAIESMEIALPPLPEQNQIATILDQHLAQVEAIKTRLDAIPTLLKRFRQSVLAAAVSGKLTEEWREKNETNNVADFIKGLNERKVGKLKVRAKKGWDEGLSLYALPNNWEWVANHKLAVDSSNAICAGPFGTIFKAKDFRDKGVPIIFLRHVKEVGFNQNKPTFMDEKVWDKQHQDYSIYGGELLVTKLGDPPGESCIYPCNVGTAMVTPDVLKMSVDTDAADTRYLMHFFNSPVCKEMVAELAFGATRLRIDIAMFKSFPIPLPPREEQSQIVHRVEQLFTFADQIEQRLSEAQARVNKLTQSILAKAFRGELTAQWRAEHPELISGEHSAQALLAKIKAERERLKPFKKTAKKKAARKRAC